jgi:hypothetical protein
MSEWQQPTQPGESFPPPAFPPPSGPAFAPPAAQPQRQPEPAAQPQRPPAFSPPPPVETPLAAHSRPSFGLGGLVSQEFVTGAEIRFGPSLPVYTDPPAKRTRGRLVGAAAAAVLLLGGVGTAVAMSSATSNGADSPEAAVKSVLSSLEAGDWLAVLESMPAGERQFYVHVLEKSMSEAKRLGFVDEKASMRKVSGIKMHFSNVTMDTEKINNHIAQVHITGGDVSTDIKVDDLPIGDLVKSLMGNHDVQPTDRHNDSSITSDTQGSIATVKDAEGWHVSPMYSLAEAARDDRTMPTTPIAANGAATAEQAVKDMVQAGLKGDLNRVIELVDPQEGAALHDYGQLLVEQADQAGLDTSGWPTLNDLQLTSSKGDFGTLVALKSIDLTTHAGDADQRITVRQDGTCTKVVVEIHGKRDTQRICADDMSSMLPTSNLVTGDPTGDPSADPSADQSGNASWESMASPAIGIMQGIISRANATTWASGFTVRQVDGKWYVSPASTVAAAGFRLVDLVTREDLEKLLIVR